MCPSKAVNINGCSDKLKHVYLMRQMLVAIGPFLITLIRGFGTGYSATLIPQLQSVNSSIPVTFDEEAWLASLAILPTPIGAILSIYFMEKYGRRMANIISCPILTIGWITIYFAGNMNIILIGRAIGGLASGLTIPPTVVYLAETTNPMYRSSFLAAFFVNSSLGSFIIHLIGTYFDWRTTALIAAISPVSCLLFLIFVPESPAWLSIKGKTEEARQAFHWCRGFSMKGEDELSRMIENVAKELESNSILNQLKQGTTPIFLKPLGIQIIFYLTLTWSGTQTIMFYSVQFAQNTFSDLDGYTATLIMDAVRVVAAGISCVIIKYVKMRPYLLATGLGSGFSLYVISLLLFLNDSYHIGPIIILIMMLLYITLTTAGLMCIAFVLGGVIFPLQVRSLGSAATNTLGSSLLFVVVQVSPYMFETLGMGGTYLVYGSACFIGSVILFFIVPETKGKTLLEIENHFK